MFVLALVLYCVLRFCFVSIRFGFCLCFGVEYLTEVVEATGCPSVVRHTNNTTEYNIYNIFIIIIIIVFFSSTLFMKLFLLIEIV